MKRSLALLVSLLSAAAVVAGCTEAPSVRNPSSAQQGGPGVLPGERVLTTGLSSPSTLVWGPDNFLWVTDRTAKQVVRINPTDGTKSTAISLPDADADGPGDGVLGLAFGGGSAFVSYTYDGSPTPPSQPRAKIVKYNFNAESGALTAPVVVLDNLPAGPRVNGGALLVGPDQKLYYTVGDLGNNEGDRDCLPILSQSVPSATQQAARDLNAYAGKVLRLNLDGGVPADNPATSGGRGHIFSVGFRDPVALVTGRHGEIFTADAGYRSDDEVDLVQSGGNYGWPFVAGFRDNAGYRYANWSAAPSCSSLTYDDYTVPAAVPRAATETQWTNPDYVDPQKTLFTVPGGYNFQDPNCGQQFPLCWPTIDPTGLAYLPADSTPNAALANSLLVSSARNGSVYLLPLTGDGGSVQGDVTQLFSTNNLYRGVAVSSDHTTVYVATDSQGTLRPRSPSQSGQLDNPGAILAFGIGSGTGVQSPLPSESNGNGSLLIPSGQPSEQPDSTSSDSATPTTEAPSSNPPGPSSASTPSRSARPSATPSG